MTGDAPVSPRQAAQLRADLMFRRARDPDLFDDLWPHLHMGLLILRSDFEWRDLFCPRKLVQAATVLVPLTDSPRPYAAYHDVATWWPLDQFGRN